MFNAVDLFSGAGGLSLGLENSGFRVVLANDFNKDACESYRLNHRSTMMVEGDIRNIDFTSELHKTACGKINLISGGPPCQGFSTIGKKMEFDERNNLFMEYIRVVELISPDYILFENVAGFKSMYKGKVFNLLNRELERLGYNISYAILNAVNFGVPQLRRRTIIVGFKKGLSFNMPEGLYASSSDAVSSIFGSAPLLAPLTLRDAISDLPEIRSGEESHEYRTSPENDYQRNLRGEETALTEHTSPKHGESLLNVLHHVPYGGSIMDVPEELRPKGYFSNTYSRLRWEDPSATMTSNFGTPSSNRCVHPVLDRGLTTREGARIQGFPDGYRLCGKRGSKNLQIGNAVPPVLGCAIGRQIFLGLLDHYKPKGLVI